MLAVTGIVPLIAVSYVQWPIGEGLDVLKYITMRGLARSCIGAPPETCKRIIRGVEQITQKVPSRAAEPSNAGREEVVAPSRRDRETAVEAPRSAPARRP